MSGGCWNYRNDTLQSDIFGWGIDTTEEAMKVNPLKDKEMSGILFDILQVLHEYDWYMSGDTNEKDYRESVKKFKEKWFTKEPSDRIMYVVDNSLKDLKEELLITFGLDERFQGEKNNEK